MTGEEFDRWLPVYRSMYPELNDMQLKDMMIEDDKRTKSKEQENVAGDGI